MGLETKPKLSYRNLADHLADEISRLIQESDLAPGDRLPTVQALAQDFSVGAPTVREALKKLEMTGLIEVRHGSGSYVRHSSGRLVLSNPFASEVDRGSILDLLEARFHIEPALAGLAAARAEDEDIDSLAALLARAADLLEGRPGDDELLNRTNMEFHVTIARSARNEVFAQTLMSLLEVRAKEQLTVLELYGDRKRDHLEHVAIMEAIADRDEARSSELMRAHLDGVRKEVQQRLDDAELVKEEK